MAQHLIQTSDLSIDQIEQIFNDADTFKDGRFYDLLKDRIIITLFFENSTRTKSSFEIAIKRLGGSVVHFDASKSSTAKGETLIDTALTLDAMRADAMIVRHKTDGVPKMLSKRVSCSIINAGDGKYSHPTQALLDLYTLTKELGSVKDRHIAIVGDIVNSRVANANIALLRRFGMKITLVAPEHFLPESDLECVDDIRVVIDSVDAIMSLRTQTERHLEPSIMSLEEYGKRYCLSKKLISDRDIVVLHPGPVHRNIDIEDALLADPRCKVLDQVRHGVDIRMAVLKNLILDAQ